MARVMQQIKQDLAALEERVANLAVELRALYSNYLNLLSQSAKKQLILASYQICTQVYPDSFLHLSTSDREKLQNDLKQLGNEIKSQFFSLLETPIQSESLAIATEEQAIELTVDAKQESINPEDLVNWCKEFEINLQETFEKLSQEANIYLQESNILPSQVPAKIIEMAMQTEGSSLPLNQAPNLLNLLIETERDSEEEPQPPQENPKITKLTAIHLRLSEIEFSDPTLSIERDRIRHGLEKLSKIRQQYRKIQREYAIAEAEAAWRSTWYED
jgi:hypothetical protein